MPNTYAVTHADIAAELPGLFKDGFSQMSRPTLQQVQSFIATADAIVSLHLRTAIGTDPSATDANAPLATRYIVDAVKADVLRVVYTGNAPQDVRDATESYDDLAAKMLDRIDAMEPVTSSGSVALGGSRMASGTTCLIPSW